MDPKAATEHQNLCELNSNTVLPDGQENNRPSIQPGYIRQPVKETGGKSLPRQIISLKEYIFCCIVYMKSPFLHFYWGKNLCKRWEGGGDVKEKPEKEEEG